MKKMAMGLAAAILVWAGMAPAKDLGVPVFNAADFGAPQDNLYMPMAPGSTYVYEAEAEDQAKVLRLDVTVSIEYGEFENCLKTKEWTKVAPGEIEHKYYAPGVGLVYIEELKEKTVRVELIDIN